MQNNSIEVIRADWRLYEKTLKQLFAELALDSPSHARH